MSKKAKIITFSSIGAVVAAVVVLGVVFHEYVGDFFDKIFLRTEEQSIADSIDLRNPKVSIMLSAMSLYPAGDDSPVVEELERVVAQKVGVDSLDIDFKWEAINDYYKKAMAIAGSGSWPHVMLINARSPEIIQCSRYGSFWMLQGTDPETGEVVDRLREKNPDGSYKYPNLAKTDDMVNHNISVDGNVYGIYRSREVGRAGVTVRADWVDKLHDKGALSFDSTHLRDLTMDEFEEMLYAFTNGDPDGDGAADTYGMVIAGADYLNGPLNNLAVWNGAPNGWGVDENGELKPAYMFPEYEDTLTKLRQWKSDGVLNDDLATFKADNWNQPFFTGGAGMIVDVADRARRVAASIANVDKSAVVDVFGYVRKDADSEPRTLPTSGNSGYFVIPKAAVRTEEELELVLKILDALNDAEASDLLNYGLLGDSYEKYTVTEKGKEVSKTRVLPEGKHYALRPDEKTGSQLAEKTTDKALLEQYNDLNQFGMGLGSSKIGTAYTTGVAAVTDAVYKENRLYKIVNPTAAYISPTYWNNSAELDPLIEKANIKYIMGEIDLDGWRNEINNWRTQGGEKIIKEMNEFYEADNAKITEEATRESNHKLIYEAYCVDGDKQPWLIESTDTRGEYKYNRTVNPLEKFLTEEDRARFAAELAEEPDKVITTSIVDDAKSTGQTVPGEN